MVKITTMDQNRRLSTQDVLEQIQAALAAGETDFYIEAAGQQDIGGPLWHPEGKPLKLVVKNPGQRVGSMCLDGTEIIVDGSAPADVGWLNSGGRIVVRGDSGDTAAHCAASGQIYIGGRAGTRSGSLMKHDPLYSPPEFWVLKNCGSFSFEFMSGGIAVICGYDCEQLASVMGERSCVGMVGGLVYFRGKATGISAQDACVMPLEEQDIRYLAGKMDDFLLAINRASLRASLTRWEEWQKVVPLPYDRRPQKVQTDITPFRKTTWVPGGIFGDIYPDDLTTVGLVPTGKWRRQVPVWESGTANVAHGNGCRDCRICLQACPENAIRRDEDGSYRAESERCIGCGLCAGICPAKIWKMRDNRESLS